MRARRWRPLLVALAALVPATGLVAALRRRRPLFAVAIAGSSMAPSFEDGDYVLIRRERIPAGELAAGLVVCVRGPADRLLLKRIVGLPGESLRIGQVVQVGGRPLVEPYAHGAASAESFRGVHGLADDEYIVLGDNRAASTDSRDFGPVHAAQIEGLAWLRYWPPERFGIIRRQPRQFLGAEAADQGIRR